LVVKRKRSTCICSKQQCILFDYAKFAVIAACPWSSCNIRNELCDVCPDACLQASAERQRNASEGLIWCADVETGFYPDAEEACEYYTRGLNCDRKEFEITSVAEKVRLVKEEPDFCVEGVRG
jgi:hypothetical protein